MWPFKNQKDVRMLEERLGRIERRFLELVEEWDDAFGRIRRAENRIVKRKREIESEAVEGNGTGVQEESTTTTLVHPGLSARQRTVQQQILRRRAGL